MGPFLKGFFKSWLVSTLLIGGLAFLLFHDKPQALSAIVDCGMPLHSPSGGWCASEYVLPSSVGYLDVFLIFLSIVFSVVLSALVSRSVQRVGVGVFFGTAFLVFVAVVVVHYIRANIEAGRHYTSRMFGLPIGAIDELATSDGMHYAEILAAGMARVVFEAAPKADEMRPLAFRTTSVPVLDCLQKWDFSAVSTTQSFGYYNICLRREQADVDAQPTGAPVDGRHAGPYVLKPGSIYMGRFPRGYGVPYVDLTVKQAGDDGLPGGEFMRWEFEGSDRVEPSSGMKMLASLTGIPRTMDRDSFDGRLSALEKAASEGYVLFDGAVSGLVSGVGKASPDGVKKISEAVYDICEKFKIHKSDSKTVGAAKEFSDLLMTKEECQAFSPLKIENHEKDHKDQNDVKDETDQKDVKPSVLQQE